MTESLTLTTLFTPGDLFDIKDAEPGPARGVRLRIGVSAGLDSPYIWAGLANLCARLSFESLVLDHSILADVEKIPEDAPCIIVFFEPVQTGHSGRVILHKAGSNRVHISGTSATGLSRILNSLAARDFPLSSIPETDFSSRPMLVQGDTITFRFSDSGTLTAATSNNTAIGSIQLAGHFSSSYQGLETNHPHFSLLDFSPLYQTDSRDLSRRILNLVWSVDSPRFSFASGKALCDAVCAMVMEATGIRLPLVVTTNHTSPPDCPGFFIKELFPEQRHTPDELTIKFSERPGSVHISGTAEAIGEQLPVWTDLALNQGGPGFAKIEAIRRKAVHAVDHPVQQDSAGLPPIVHRTTWESETDEILTAVSCLTQGNGFLACHVWISKPPHIRSDMKKKVSDLLTAKGYIPDVQVFNAFKPGLCRILEMTDKIPAAKKPASINITFQPFPGDGRGVNNPLESRHRWLQELFPISEVLAQRLDIPARAVTLSMDENQPEIYRVTARDKEQTVIFQDTFSPFFHTRYYMDSFPELGSVSPCCAGICIKNTEGLVLEQAFFTDRDRFWQKFQTGFVPDLINTMESMVCKGLPEEGAIFFDTISLEVYLDETREKLGFMDEQISPMESLHEDLYFYLLELFTRFVQRHNLPETVKLGQILPRVHARVGVTGPGARMTACPMAVSPPETIPIACQGRQPDMLVLAGNGITVFGTSETASHINLPDFRVEVLPSDGCGSETVQSPIPRDRVLASREVYAHLSRLNTIASVQVWEIARSLQGRGVFAVEAFEELSGRPGRKVSIPRLRLTKPTVLFNARHHANEVSSTTAVLQFIDFLGTESGRALLASANVVFIPLENVDGVATFESLYQKDCADMLHAARYNALGAEFYAQYFKHPPAFPEALAKQRLWQRWLPELMADLHGVPSHEWCQPYSGYLPKGFEEFWIPRAFVYVHLPFLENPDHFLHPKALALAEKMRTTIAADPDIVAANEKITAMYRKYARIPEPDIFPDADSTELTALPLLGRARHDNFAVQYPDITCSEVIVEVPDEVAHGQNLDRCIRAHYRIQQTLVKALTSLQTKAIARIGPDWTEFEIISFRSFPDSAAQKAVKKTSIHTQNVRRRK